MNQQRGYIILVPMLIIGAVASVIAISLLVFGIDYTRSSLSHTNGYRATALADACVETALYRISDQNFGGSDTLNLDGNTCSYTVLQSGGQIRNISVTASVGEHVRHIEASTSQRTPSIIVDRWEDVQ